MNRFPTCSRPFGQEYTEFGARETKVMSLALLSKQSKLASVNLVEGVQLAGVSDGSAGLFPLTGGTTWCHPL